MHHGFIENREWWLCTEENIKRTCLCWVVLMLVLSSFLTVSYTVCKYPFLEKNYVLRYPFNAILDVPVSTPYHSVECENCEIFGLNENLDGYFENKYVSEEISFQGVDVFFREFNDLVYSCVEFELREEENYALNLMATKSLTNFVLHYAVTEQDYFYTVDNEKLLPLKFTAQNDEFLHVCVHTYDTVAPFGSFFSSEVTMLNDGTDVEKCSSICSGFKNYFIQPKIGLTTVHYYEYLPPFLVFLTGFFLFLIFLLLSVVFSHKTVIGCIAYPCLRERNEFENVGD